MDERGIVWDTANRKHLGEDHPERGISLRDIEEVLSDPEKVETFRASRGTYQTIGHTQACRWLVVVWLDQPDGAYPIHARSASKRIVRRLTT